LALAISSAKDASPTPRRPTATCWPSIQTSRPGGRSASSCCAVRGGPRTRCGLPRARGPSSVIRRSRSRSRGQRSSSSPAIATRRYAFYAPRRPDGLTPAERWFAETGTVVLASDDATAAPDDGSLAAAFVDLARDSGWRFGQIVALAPALAVWRTMADALRVPVVTRSGFDPAACPLVVAQLPQPADNG